VSLLEEEQRATSTPRRVGPKVRARCFSKGTKTKTVPSIDPRSSHTDRKPLPSRLARDEYREYMGRSNGQQ
jgi:hypothetical protein